MTVTIATTPNPASRKFTLDRQITTTPNEVERETASTISPLANVFYKTLPATSIYIGTDFVTITLHQQQDWDRLFKGGDLAQGIAQQIDMFARSGQSFIAAPVDSAVTTHEDTLMQDLRRIMEQKIAPAITQDGGEIELRGHEYGIVWVDLKGACTSCPHSQGTLKQAMLKMFVASGLDVTDVRQVDRNDPRFARAALSPTL